MTPPRMFLVTLICLLMPSLALAQPGPDRETEPYRGEWTAQLPTGERIWLGIELGMAGPMEAAWLVSGAASFTAGRRVDISVRNGTWHSPERAQEIGTNPLFTGEVRAEVRGQRMEVTQTSGQSIHLRRVSNNPWPVRNDPELARAQNLMQGYWQGQHHVFSLRVDEARQAHRPPEVDVICENDEVACAHFAFGATVRYASIDVVLLAHGGTPGLTVVRRRPDGIRICTPASSVVVARPNPQDVPGGQVLVPPPSGWGLYADGMEARERGDNREAATLFTRACDAGAVEGCRAAGGAYEHGQGVPVNVPRALRLYELACDGDEGRNPEACFLLGRLRQAQRDAP